MTASVLQSFVRESLIELDGEDSRLAKLQAAATALAADCEAGPIATAFPLLFAALRPEDATTGSSFEDVANVIEEHWSTYKSVFKDGRATTLYRAVALQAIVEAIDSAPALGTAIALLLRNLRSGLATGKYESAIKIVAEAAEEAFASERESSMTAAEKVDAPLAAAAKTVKIDRANLKKRIEAAVGPHDRQGQPLESPNPHWTNANNPWSYEFSDRMTAIIGDFVDLAIAESAKLDAKNHGAVGASLSAIGKIDPALKRSVGLLWWRQALYSESAGQPYRALPRADAVVHAVIDLAAQIPPAYEPALDSFLMEAILALNLDHQSIDSGAILEALPLARQRLDEALEYEAPAGLMIYALSKKETSGLLAEPVLEPHLWAVWLIREVMALRAVEGLQAASEESEDQK
ncbi:MAG TPA: GTPase-associated system all-helical protein GASH [Roseateles sp.]